MEMVECQTKDQYEKRKQAYDPRNQHTSHSLLLVHAVSPCSQRAKTLKWGNILTYYFKYSIYYICCQVRPNKNYPNLVWAEEGMF